MGRPVTFGATSLALESLTARLLPGGHDGLRQTSFGTWGVRYVPSARRLKASSILGSEVSTRALTTVLGTSMPRAISTV